MRKFLRWSAILFSALIVMGYIYDEKLDEGVEEVLAPPPVDVPAADNAYFSLIGFAAPPGNDPHAEGREITEKLQAAFREDLAAIHGDREELVGPLQFHVVDDGGLLEGCCSWQGFLDLARDRRDEVEALLAANGELLERYRSLAAYHRFQETLPMPFEAVDYGLVQEAHKLKLLAAARDIAGGSAAEAVDALVADLLFWRMVLREGRHLDGAMTATGRIRRDLAAVSTALADPAVDEERAAALKGAVAPLGPGEKDLRQEIDRESAVILTRLVDTFDDIAPVNPMRVVMKKNATLNYTYTMMTDKRELYYLPAREYMKRREELKNGSGPAGEKPPAPSWYNPIGRSFADMAVPDYYYFPQMLHILDAHLTLVRLQLEIKGRPVSGGEMDTFLAEACPPLCNPFDMTPAAWDSERQVIAFTVPKGKETSTITAPLSPSP